MARVASGADPHTWSKSLLITRQNIHEPEGGHFPSEALMRISKFHNKTNLERGGRRTDKHSNQNRYYIHAKKDLQQCDFWLCVFEEDATFSPGLGFFLELSLNRSFPIF